MISEGVGGGGTVSAVYTVMLAPFGGFVYFVGNVAEQQLWVNHPRPIVGAGQLNDAPPYRSSKGNDAIIES